MVKVKKTIKKATPVPDKKKKGRFQRMESLDWKWVSGAMAVTFLAFVLTLSHDFVNWDDDYNLANNNNTALLNWDNIVNIFSEPVIGNYNPLPILTFAIERKFFGLDPAIYHVNNLLLHLACVFFVYRIFRSLNLSNLAAGIGALLFGIHPMRVESVAWVTERKDVLFGVFFLSALWYYIQYVRSETRTKKYFYYALILFVFSLFAKIQAVSLPLAMLLVDYYFKRPLKLNLVIEKWLFFLMSLIIGLVGIYFLRDQGSINDTTTYTLLERILIGGYSLGVYLIKFVFPYVMSPLYPYPAEIPWQVYLGPIAFVAILSFAYIGFKKEWRPYVFGVLFFLFNVMFVLQVVGAGQGFLADRFTYIPYLGLMFIVAYAVDHLMKRNVQTGKYALYGVSGLLLIYLVMTFNQTRIWKDSDALWTHVLKHENKTPLPYRNRANFRRDQGRIEEALADYNAAIALKPDGALYNSRAKLYFNLKKYPEAMENYNLAIALDSLQGEYYVNRGAVFALTNQLERSLADFNRGLTLSPDHANGYKNRSLVYQTFGQYDKALEDVATYLRMHPEDADLWYESGRLKNALNNGAAALPDLDRAIQLNNKQGLYHYEKLKSYLLMGQKAKAQQMVPVVQQFGIQIEPEVQAKLNE